MAIVVCMACAVALVEAAKNPGTAARGISITSTYTDTATDVVSSGGSGAYYDGVSAVQSELLDNTEGNLALDTNTSSKAAKRTMRLAFGQQLAVGTLTRVPSCTTGSIATGCTIVIDGLMISRSAFFDGLDNLRTMQVGQIVPKNLVIDWYDGNTPYRLRYDGQNGASFANFTCEAQDVSGACSQWAVTPGDGTTREQAGSGACPSGAYNCYSGAVSNSRANLYRMSSSMTNQYLVKTVDAPFTLVLTRP
jgi:hypothetical protein